MPIRPKQTWPKKLEKDICRSDRGRSTYVFSKKRKKLYRRLYMAASQVYLYCELLLYINCDIFYNVDAINIYTCISTYLTFMYIRNIFAWIYNRTLR